MNFLDKMLLDGINWATNMTNYLISSISDIIAQSPDTYNPTIWGFMIKISEIAVKPFAYVFLSFVLTMEIYEIVTQYNNNHVLIPESIFKLALKSYLGITLIEKTFTIMLAIFDITNRMTVGANSTITGLLGDTSADITALTASIADMGFLEKLVTFTTITPPLLLLAITNLIIRVLVYSRFIEIYVYTAVAPLPISMVISRNMGSTGKRFLLNYAAIALQGVFYVIIIGIYGAVVAHAGAGGGDNFTSAIFNVMFYSSVLIFCLFKSGSWAKNVLGA